MESATLLYYKKAKQVWVAMCGSKQVKLPVDALRKLEGDQMRPFASAEPRKKPRQKDAVKFIADNGEISEWALVPA